MKSCIHAILDIRNPQDFDINRKQETSGTTDSGSQAAARKIGKDGRCFGFRPRDLDSERELH